MGSHRHVLSELAIVYSIVDSYESSSLFPFMHFLKARTIVFKIIQEMQLEEKPYSC